MVLFGGAYLGNAEGGQTIVLDGGEAHRSLWLHPARREGHPVHYALPVTVFLEFLAISGG